MTERRDTGDRRKDTRLAAAGRIHWRRDSDATAHRGWLSDRSQSSLSFIAGSPIEPKVGDRISVVGPDRCYRVYRVVRTTPYDNDLSLVACTSNDPSPSRR